MRISAISATGEAEAAAAAESDPEAAQATPAIDPAMTEQATTGPARLEPVLEE